MIKGLLSAACVIALTAAPCYADNWPAWRGSDNTGATATNGPVSIDKDSLLWKAPLPGRGCSTPIIWGDKLFITCADNEKDSIIAFDLHGKKLWQHTFGQEAILRHQQAGSGSNPSITTDGKHVFAYFKSGTLAALTLEGKLAWEKNLQEIYGPNGLKWDLGTSPILAGGNLVVAIMHAEHPSYLLAFDKDSGTEVWKTSRDMNAPAECNDAYTTPFTTKINGIETIVTWGGDHLTGHNAHTGKELWHHGNFNPDQASNWRTIASAIPADDIAIVPYGRGAHMAGVKMGGSGDTTQSHRLWTLDGAGSDSCTPISHKERVYVLADKKKAGGKLDCIDSQTGKIIWTHNFPRAPQNYYASPLIAGNRLYAARSDGTVFCGTLSGNGLSDVSEHKLQETTVASPVVIDGKLLIRTHSHLWCFN